MNNRELLGITITPWGQSTGLILSKNTLDDSVVLLLSDISAWNAMSIALNGTEVQRLIDFLKTHYPETTEPDLFSCLTPRERDVATLLRGRSNSGIAGILGISSETVKRHLHDIYAKLGVSSRDYVIDAVLYRNTRHAVSESTHQRAPVGFDRP